MINNNSTADTPHETSAILAAIEATWRTIQGQHPEVPPALLRLSKGSDPRRPQALIRGTWAPSRWAAEGQDVTALEDLHHEVTISGERLRDGARGVLETLLHEAAHGVAHALGIKDTSRQGRYHNKHYRANAEALGLAVSRNDRQGWTVTHLTPALEKRYAAEIAELEAVIRGYRLTHREIVTALVTGAGPEGEAGAGEGEDQGETEKPKPKGGRVRHMCGCPRKIYVARQVAAEAAITCEGCGQAFSESIPA